MKETEVKYTKIHVVLFIILLYMFMFGLFNFERFAGQILDKERFVIN